MQNQESGQDSQKDSVMALPFSLGGEVWLTPQDWPTDLVEAVVQLLVFCLLERCA